MSSNLVTSKRKLVLEGRSAKSQNDAVQDAFRKLQSEAYKATDRPIIYMKPVNVTVLENELDSENEKFLLVLFPRTKTSYHVKLEVEVEMSELVL